MDDRAFVGGDGMGSVGERGADVIDGGLAGFYVERCGFEEDVGFGGGEPGVYVSEILHPRGHGGHRGNSGLFGVCLSGETQAARIGDPSQAAGGDAGDAEGDAVAGFEFLSFLLEQPDEGAIDVTEAEEAEIEVADGGILRVQVSRWQGGKVTGWQSDKVEK